MALTVKTKKKKGVPIIELIGRAIDVDVLKFTKKLNACYKQKCKTVVIDLTRTNFIDSHCLGSIVYFHNQLEKENKKLLLFNSCANPSSYVTRLIELTNLNKVLHIVDSLDSIADAK
ncbi:MAG: STAS domain-containing protein [Chitinivibrionales bacterium]|nr:STAS domain-containing protein [Chitinivibrionales bacterium]